MGRGAPCVCGRGWPIPLEHRGGSADQEPPGKPLQLFRSDPQPGRAQAAERAQVWPASAQLRGGWRGPHPAGRTPSPGGAGGGQRGGPGRGGSPDSWLGPLPRRGLSRPLSSVLPPGRESAPASGAAGSHAVPAQRWTTGQALSCLAQPRVSELQHQLGHLAGDKLSVLSQGRVANSKAGRAGPEPTVSTWGPTHCLPRPAGSCLPSSSVPLNAVPSLTPRRPPSSQNNAILVKKGHWGVSGCTGRTRGPLFRGWNPLGHSGLGRWEGLRL